MAEQLQNMFLWLSDMELRTELMQLHDEGKEISPAVEAEFQKLLALDYDRLMAPSNQAKAGRLLGKTIRLRVNKGFAFEEPSDLDHIRRLRPPAPQAEGDRPENYEPGDCPRFTRHAFSAVESGLSLAADGVVTVPIEIIADRIHGAWLGRCIGCFLGKAAEGLRTDRLWPFLKESNQWPLNGYIRFGIDHLARKYPDITALRWSDALDYMPVDDDTNYTTACLLILQKYGKDFSPADVAQFWMENIPLQATFTAERVAYRNFALNIPPPKSAGYRNPYREWIGAQIRADAYGYVNVGNPERAAEFAWRDACLSHVKNGIYGAMFIAALIAAAPHCRDMTESIQAALSQIPQKCRLTAQVKEALEWRRQELSYDEAVAHIHKKWDEYNFHHWCHTISNAAICVVALLWGENDFGLSICRAVQAGFDTDCNGATVGSIMGMRLGTAAIEPNWSARLNNTLHTALAGRNIIPISQLAQDTFELYKRYSDG